MARFFAFWNFNWAGKAIVLFSMLAAPGITFARSHEVPLFDELGTTPQSGFPGSGQGIGAAGRRAGTGHAWMDKCLHSVDLKTCLGGARDLR